MTTIIFSNGDRANIVYIETIDKWRMDYTSASGWLLWTSFHYFKFRAVRKADWVARYYNVL
jgi:hypothetical protein